MSVLLAIFLSVAYCYLSVIWFYRYHWHQLNFFFSKGTSDSLPSLSVIIPARNEEKNIAACLQSLANNKYAGPYEVFVVDDFSEDDTCTRVESFPEVRLIKMANEIPVRTQAFKKMAIASGISKSTGEIIVCTDADCVVPENWLQNIGEFYAATHFCMLIMPVKITSANNFWQNFQALDFLTLQGITAAAAHAQKPIMCNGANLAYTRAAFSEVKGFQNIDDVASGDDVLLMQKIERFFPGKTYFLKSAQAIVQTQPQKGFQAFLQQRVRWGGKTARTKNYVTIAIALLVYVFNFLLVSIPIICIWENPQLTFLGISLHAFRWWLIVFFTKVISELFFLTPVARFFNQQKLLKWFIAMQPIHMLYIVLAGALGWQKQYEWKGRKLH